jgi:hypothetical protein
MRLNGIDFRIVFVLLLSRSNLRGKYWSPKGYCLVREEKDAGKGNKAGPDGRELCVGSDLKGSDGA